MFSFIRDIYRRFHNLFAIAFVAAFAATWILGQAWKDSHAFQQAVAGSLTLILLLLCILQDYADSLVRRPAIRVFPDQDAVNGQLDSFLSHSGIAEKAELIEYDGESVKPVIRAALRLGKPVHLLLQHPEYAVSRYQFERIKHQIRTCEDDFAENFDKLRILYYTDWASLRGRRFDNKLICAGWYTYDRRRRPAEREVWGHNNPCVILESGDPGFNELSVMFDRVFNALQSNAEPFEKIRGRVDALQWHATPDPPNPAAQ